MKLDRCPSTLRPGFTTYTTAALRKLFSGKKVDHVLPFLPPGKDASVREAFMESRKRMSISGVQEKLSLRLEKNKLRLCQPGESGHYILKPIPPDVRQPDQVPANENLTMQLAEQIFKISVAPNAMIFFRDDQPAYITRRFDYKPVSDDAQELKYGVEDFASLAQKSSETHGTNFKYNGSYEDMFKLLKQYVGPYLVEAQKLFRLMLFNYVTSNGDAHLKNYSLIETSGGDYIISPAYDLMNTRLHVNDSDVALQEGLFDEYETESFQKNGFYAYDDFFQLGVRAGIAEPVVRKEIERFHQVEKGVEDMVLRSFLNDEAKASYIKLFEDKVGRLSYSYEKLV